MTVVTVYAVFANADEATRVGRAIVEEKLAACVNILGPCHSIYRWQGAIETATEFGNRIYLEACNRGWSLALTKVVIGDGAEWIWNIASQHFPARFRSWTFIMPVNTYGPWLVVCSRSTSWLKTDGSRGINPNSMAAKSKSSWRS